MPSLRSVTDNDSYAINMKYSGGFTKVFHPVHLKWGISTLFFFARKQPTKKKIERKESSQREPPYNSKTRQSASKFLAVILILVLKNSLFKTKKEKRNLRAA